MFPLKTNYILLSNHDPYDGFPDVRDSDMVYEDATHTDWYERDDGSSCSYGDYTMPEIPIGMVPEFPDVFRRRYLPPSTYEIQTNFIIPEAPDRAGVVRPTVLRPVYMSPDDTEDSAVAAEPESPARLSRLETRRLPALVDGIDGERVWFAFGAGRPRGWAELSRLAFVPQLNASVAVTIARDRLAPADSRDIYIVEVEETDTCPRYLKRIIHDIITMCSYPPEHALSGCYDILDRACAPTAPDDAGVDSPSADSVQRALDKLARAYGRKFTVTEIYGPRPSGQTYAEYATLQDGLQIPGFVLRQSHIPAGWNNRHVDVVMAYSNMRGWQPVAVYPRMQQAPLVL